MIFLDCLSICIRHKAGCIKKIIIVAHVALVQTIILIPTVGRNIAPICLLRSAHHVAQYRRRFLCKSDSPKAFIFFCIVMSEMLLGNHFSHDIQKVIAISVMAAISDPAIHGVWLPVDQFREHLHEKYSFGDNIQFNTNRLIRYLNKVFPNQSLESNEVTISTGKKVMVFRHEYQTKVKSRQRFIYITGKTVSAVPKLPTYDNSSEWEEKCVPLKRLLLRNGNWGNDGQNFRDGHHVNSSSSGSSNSPQLLEKEVTLHTAFDSNSKITMTGLGDELNSRKRTSEQQEGEEEGKEATSRLLLLGGSDESSEHHLLENSNMGQNQKATGPISTWYCSSKIALMFSKYSTLNSISCFFLITPVGTTVRKKMA